MLGLLQKEPIQQQQGGIPAPVTVEYDSVELRVFDMGGKTRTRALWPMFVADAHGVVFVVDSANIERLGEAAEALHELMRHTYSAGKYVLVVANKQDLPLACSEEEVAWQLALERYPADS